jgi:hypothetical protein
MTLFTREAARSGSDDERKRAWAHAILDLWKAGKTNLGGDGKENDLETVESALRITGDLL